MEKTYKRLSFLNKKLANRLFGGFALLAAFLPLSAKCENLRLISDEETEQYLANIIKPLYEKAMKLFTLCVKLVSVDKLLENM